MIAPSPIRDKLLAEVTIIEESCLDRKHKAIAIADLIDDAFYRGRIDYRSELAGIPELNGLVLPPIYKPRTDVR